MVSAIRALTALTAVSWISFNVLQVAAQVPGPTFTGGSAPQQAPHAWYPYRGTVQWTIGPNGQPIMSPSESPLDLDAHGPTTSRIGWQAPVVPASPVGGYPGPMGSSLQPSTTGPLAADAPAFARQNLIGQAESCCTGADAEPGARRWRHRSQLVGIRLGIDQVRSQIGDGRGRRCLELGPPGNTGHAQIGRRTRTHCAPPRLSRLRKAAFPASQVARSNRVIRWMRYESKGLED